MPETNSLVKGDGLPEIDKPLEEGALVVPQEQPCWLCNHPQREEIEEHYRDFDHHVGRTAKRFGIASDALRVHLPHFRSTSKAKQDSAGRLRQRIRNRAKTLHDFMIQAGTAVPAVLSEDGSKVITLPRSADWKAAAAIAEVLRRYDEMLLKLHQAPGFKATEGRGTTKVDAPGGKFLIVQNPPAGQLPPPPED